MKIRIAADNTIPFLKGITESVAEIKYLPAKGFTNEAIRDTDVLIVRSIDKCTPQLLEGSGVKLITTATIGYDHIDTLYCEKNGIAWCNAPGCNACSVAQYVISSILTISLRRKESLKGKKLGIIGVGHVGRQVERLAGAFGMQILRNDPPRVEKEGKDGVTRFVPLDELLEESDIVTLHVPLTHEGHHSTFHLAGKQFFDKMKRGSWFINSCRGAVHDTEALLRAHDKGIIAETIIDCWENEPDINARLLEISSIASPHIAGFSFDGKANATRMCLENIERFFRIKFDRLNEVVPPAPETDMIDMDEFEDHRIERAFLRTFNPGFIDSELRKERSSFEYLRNHYDNPREPKAYRVKNATTEESAILQAVGFNVL